MLGFFQAKKMKHQRFLKKTISTLCFHHTQQVGGQTQAGCQNQTT